jgi:hypothetical protein
MRKGWRRDMDEFDGKLAAKNNLVVFRLSDGKALGPAL